MACRVHVGRSKRTDRQQVRTMALPHWRLSCSMPTARRGGHRRGLPYPPSQRSLQVIHSPDSSEQIPIVLPNGRDFSCPRMSRGRVPPAARGRLPPSGLHAPGTSSRTQEGFAVPRRPRLAGGKRTLRYRSGTIPTAERAPAMPGVRRGRETERRMDAPRPFYFLLGRLPTARIVTALASAPRDTEPQGVRRARGRSGG